MELKEQAIKVRWVESHLMVGADSRGTPLAIGTWPEQNPEWRGMKASDLLLLAAASYSTYDIASILNKQREPLVSIETTCTGQQQVDPPFKFTRIHLHYVVKGKVNPERVARAIQLSEEKNCSVTNTLRGSVAITSDFEIVG